MCRTISPFCEQPNGGERPNNLPGEEMVLFREGQGLQSGQYQCWPELGSREVAWINMWHP